MTERPLDRHELEKALGSIRTDVHSLHHDLVLAARDGWHWTFVTLWLVFALVLKEFWELGNLAAFSLSLLVTRIYLEIEGFRIARRPLQIAKTSARPLS